MSTTGYAYAAAINKIPNKTVVSPKAMLKLPITGQVKLMCKPVVSAMSGDKPLRVYAPVIPKPG
ncbi:MAG: hypothetical protein ACYT04_99820, partial [Nostoc sp.]